MKDGKPAKGPLGMTLLGIGFMGVLYGWIVYAGEIETDVKAISTSIEQASNGQLPLDENMVKMLEQLGNGVETLQNSGINKELYGSNLITPMDAMITNHFGKYCAQDTESGDCPTDVLLQYGDVKVSSILSGTTYDATRTQAAQDFLTNLVAPPLGPNVANFQSIAPIDVAKITADPTLKASFVQALSEEALLSIVRQSFSEMIAKRTVSPSGHSEMEMMEQQAIQRIMSARWAQTLPGASAEALAGEQVRMQAYQVWMEYQRYRQTERVEALLAALVLQNFRLVKATSSVAKAPAPQEINNAVQQTGGTPILLPSE